MAQIIAVCGLKNSGKTTLIGKLVDWYTARGKKVAVIKHDGHDFDCDLPGTDTHAFTEHGAYGVACFSAHRYFIHVQCANPSEAMLMEMFPEADLLFIEGLKDSGYAKIEVMRACISSAPVSNPGGRFLIATDWPPGTFDEAMIDINDIAGIARAIDTHDKRMEAGGKSGDFHWGDAP